jgi:hypothetical protein
VLVQLGLVDGNAKDAPLADDINEELRFTVHGKSLSGIENE